MPADIVPRAHRFTVHEYHNIASVLGREDARVDLIDGEIIDMAPIGSRHAACVARLTKLLERAVGDVAQVDVQNTIRIDDDGEPQPDLALLRPRSDVYTEALPEPHDVLLLIEVAVTSAEYEHSVKLPLYARAGVPELWTVDLPTQHVIVHTRLEGGEYRVGRVCRSGEMVRSDAVPRLELPAEAILG